MSEEQSLAQIAQEAGMDGQTFLNELVVHMIRFAKMTPDAGGEAGVQLKVSSEEESWVVSVQKEVVNEG